MQALVATCESALIAIEYIIEELSELCDDCADLYFDDIKMLEVEASRIKNAIRVEIGVKEYLGDE